MYAARAVTVSAGGKILLNGADLRLVPGKVVAVVGPNGAGKSTLLKVMAGDLRTASGDVDLDGRPLSAWSAAALARRRAVLPQSVEVVFPFLVSEIVTLGMPAEIAAATRDGFMHRALAAVDMAEFASRLYGTLSGGEKQRVQLARVLAQVWSCECTYLLLDEPTSSLDLAHQLLILCIARHHADGNGSVLMIMHDLNLACMAADEIVALRDGCRIAAGPPAEIVTDDLIAALYGVRARVRGVPEGPFLLPQTAQLPM